LRGLLERGIRFYRHRITKTQKRHIHPCSDRDSNQRYVTAVEDGTYRRPSFRCDQHYTHSRFHIAPSPCLFHSKTKSLLNNYKWHHTQENIIRFPLIGFLFLIKEVIHVNIEIKIREISAMMWEKCITLKCNTVEEILKWIPGFK